MYHVNWMKRYRCFGLISIYSCFLHLIFTEFIQTQSCQLSELRRCVDFSESQKSRADEAAKLDQLCNKIEYNVKQMNEAFLARVDREHKQRLEMYATQR